MVHAQAQRFHESRIGEDRVIVEGLHRMAEHSVGARRVRCVRREQVVEIERERRVLRLPVIARHPRLVLRVRVFEHLVQIEIDLRPGRVRGSRLQGGGRIECHVQAGQQIDQCLGDIRDGIGVAERHGVSSGGSTGQLDVFARELERFDRHFARGCLQVRAGPLHREGPMQHPALDVRPRLVAQDHRDVP